MPEIPHEEPNPFERFESLVLQPHAFIQPRAQTREEWFHTVRYMNHVKATYPNATCHEHGGQFFVTALQHPGSSLLGRVANTALDAWRNALLRMEHEN